MEKTGELPYIIAVDFDGTLCEDKWPEIGKAKRALILYLKEKQRNGTKLILWTCRTGDQLKKAVQWCLEHSLIFDAVNENIPEAVEAYGGESRKIFAHEYIDDKALNPFYPFNI